MEAGLISLLPPLLAIFLAIVTRHVYFSLFSGIWLGYILLASGNLFTGLADSLESVVQVLSNPGDARILLFTLAIGALIATLEKSQGVKGFVLWVERHRVVTGSKSAQWLAWVSGIVIFIESNITLLISGAVSRPLFDRFNVSREKLAYIIDSTSAPVCILIPLNAWGAFNLGLLNDLGDQAPLETFLASIPYNFYTLAAVLMVPLLLVLNIDFGPMKKAQNRALRGDLHGLEDLSVDETKNERFETNDPVSRTRLAQEKNALVPKARNMFIPIGAMALMMPIGLYITGNGNLMKGSGSTSILWSVLFALTVAWISLLWQKVMTFKELNKTFMQGASNLLPIAFILLLALALGDLTEQLGTGKYIASTVASSLPAFLLLPIVFLVAAVMAFSVGSSWGTFAIMVPIAVPIAIQLNLPAAPFFAAVLSGGIFGDHASPISDTTIVASMAAGTDHIDHVRTQLPYALTAGSLALIGFVLTGLTL